MDKPEIPYIHVKANGNVLERGELRRTFSKFGNINRVYISPESTYANLFFDNAEAVTAACSQSNVIGFTVVPGFERKPHKKSHQRYSFDDLNSSASSSINLDSREMEEVATYYAGDYVDINGRPVVFLESDDGDLYISFKDIKKAGFNVFPRKLYETASISNEDVLKEVEAKIMHYGMECLLETHRVFTEKEMINMFERVKAVVFDNKSKPAATVSQNRQISNPQETRFKITVGNNASPSAGNSYKKISFDDRQITYQKQQRPTSLNRTSAANSSNTFQNGIRGPLPINFQPTFSYKNSEKREPRLEYTGPRHSGDSRGKTPVRESRPPRVERTDDASQVSKQRSVSKDKPSITYAKVDPPEQESQDAQIANGSTAEDIERVTLDKGSFELKVTYLLSEKPIFYAQLLKHYNIVEDIMVHVNSKDALLPVIAKPKKDMLVVVQFEELWYRGLVLRDRMPPGAALVELLDYGNREEIRGNIRQMSEEMKQIPAQAIRFTAHSHSTVSFKDLAIDQEIDVVVTKQFENAGITYLVDIKRILGLIEQEAETPLVEKQPVETVQSSPKPTAKKEECFLQVAETTGKIVPGEPVFILNHTDDQLIVKNKEMATLTKKISSLVASSQHNPVTDPKVGQYVLCNSFDFGDGLFRAVIKEINGKVASLELIDFSIEETLPLTSLKNINETLASFPPAKIKVNYPPLKNVTDEGIAFLSSLIIEKIKIKYTEANGEMDFNVNGELLSQKITPKLRPPKSDAAKPPKSDPTPSHRETTPTKDKEPVKPAPVAPVVRNKEYVKFKYELMPVVEPKPGLKHYCCYSNDGPQLTLLDLSEENVELIERIFVEEPEDNEPFKPELFEMCLAKFEDTWFRGTPIDEEHDQLEILFVDYGNLAKVDKKDIRKLPEDFKTIPILGIGAKIKGIEVTAAVNKRLKELIEDGTTLKVDVKVDEKDPNCLNYPVEIPEIHEILKKEGLI